MVWFPQNEQSIPTPLEHTYAREAIDSLEQDLEKNLVKAGQLEKELRNTQVETEKIKNEIFRRLVWLAPIRRVPAEVLSMFFIHACQDSWKAPLTIGAVCSRWRTVLLGTPRAWALIQITPSTQLFNHKLVDLWLSRCGALKVDVSLRRNASPQVVDAVCRHEQNLQSLSFFGNAKQLLRQYTQLEELRLGPESLFLDWQSSTTALHGNEALEKKHEEEERLKFVEGFSRFPKLLSLHLHGPSRYMMETIARQSLFPSLQTLHIHTSGHQWLPIIQCCAEFLTTLILEASPHAMVVPVGNSSETIAFPQLRNLHYILVPPVSVFLRFPSLQTPRLQSYHEFNGRGISPMHSDVSSITHLFLDQPEDVSWPSFSSLTHLHLCDTVISIFHEMSTLAANGSLCPNLSSIECVPFGSSPAQEVEIALAFADRSALTGKSISFRYRDEEYDLRADKPSCFTLCQSHSPPNGGKWDPYEEAFYYSNEDDDDDNDHYYDDQHYDDYDSFDSSHHDDIYDRYQHSNHL